MSLRARLVIVAAGVLFVSLNLVQLLVFGAPFGTSAALDLRLGGYSAADARAFLDGIGGAGRDVFFGLFRWIDTAFPPLLALSLLILFRQIRPHRKGMITVLFALLPLAYLSADFVENSFLRDLQIEAGFEATARFASEATRLKFSILGVSGIVLLLFAALERKARA